MTVIETLIKQCMDSGFFKSEEAARRYVMQNCIAKNVIDDHYAEGEEVFKKQEVNNETTTKTGNSEIINKLELY